MGSRSSITDIPTSTFKGVLVACLRQFSDISFLSMSCLIFVIFVIDSVDLIEGVGLYIRSLTRAAALLATKFLVLKKSLKLAEMLIDCLVFGLGVMIF